MIGQFLSHWFRNSITETDVKVIAFTALGNYFKVILGSNHLCHYL